MAKITVKLPDELHQRLVLLAETMGRSVEELLVAALKDHVKRMEDRNAFEDAFAFGERLKAKYGVLPDSTPEIRRAREELLTHLDEGSNP